MVYYTTILCYAIYIADCMKSVHSLNGGFCAMHNQTNELNFFNPKKKLHKKLSTNYSTKRISSVTYKI